jgi:asparagine synthase (glutamine-hydrolysing)
MLDPLDHRGPDGRDLVVDGSIAVGHQHHWTTPEEVGERQPVVSADGRFTVGFDGRLDNREELAAAIGIDAVALGGVSDATLVVRAFERWDEECFLRLLGPFAVVVADRVASTLVCARDSLGDRTLFYGGDHGLIVVASEEQAVLAHPRLGADLDEASLAALCAVRARPVGSSFFRHVRELPQGHRLRIDPSGATVHGYWTWQPREVRYRRDVEYAERFRELLTTAVRCRMRAPKPPGVLMSGGLDSTSVACLAAHDLGSDRRLRTVSWVFDELESCDERRYMDAITTRWNTVPLRVLGDDGWPLHLAETWPHNPNRPIDNAYRILKDRAFTAAREHGLGVLLTGGWGDHLYHGSAGWLVEQLGSGRWWTAARELAWHAVIGRPNTEPGLRRFAAQLLRRQLTGTTTAPPWLTPYAADLLELQRCLPRGLEGWRRPDQAAMVCGPMAADSAAAETFHAARHRIELRHPYRDRRLVEFMLAVPADQLYRRGRLKYVLRMAMEGLLPDVVRLRRRPTSLFALYRRGMVEREHERIQHLLAEPDAMWRRHVYPHQLLRVLPRVIADGSDGPAGLVPWYCAYMEVWRQLGAHTQHQTVPAACA